jgi:hypothetical protein
LAKPLVWSIGGTGTALRACTPHDDDGIFDATKWVTVVYLPVLPLHRARYRLVERRTSFPGRRALILQRVADLELGLVGVVRTYVLAWLGVPLALGLPMALLGLPGILAGRPALAAAGAVLSTLWMMPFGIGVLLWTLGQPWPLNPPRTSWTAFVLELQRSAPGMGVAVAATFVLLGGSCGLLRVVIDGVNGLGTRQALLGGAENAAFFLVLCALVGPGLWLAKAWRAARE